MDEIRENGNEANHEIREVTIEQARSVLDFVTMLLELLYEFPEGGRRSQLTRAEATNPAHPSGEV